MLARQDKPAAPADLTEEQALAELEKLPRVLSKGHPAPLSSPDQKRHFLRAGQEKLGSLRATIDWFAQIRPVKVPGSVVLHDSAATRLEAVGRAMGKDMPSAGGGFELRAPFTAESHFSRLSHHTFGLAIDYDPTNMVRIGSRRVVDRKQTAHTADFLEAVSGTSHLVLGGNSRELIRQMGAAGAAGGDATKVKGAAELLERIDEETDRLAADSEDFQQSLGTQKAAFLALRDEYFKPGIDPKTVLAKVPAVVAPWLQAIDDAEDRLRDLADNYGFDRDNLTDARGVAALQATMKDLDVDDLAELAKLARSRAIVANYGDLRTMLKTDPVFLFGTAPRPGVAPSPIADTPPLAQLVEHGFFTTGDVGTTPATAGRFDQKFIMEMAKHGFDVGASWGGADTDSMHFELVSVLG
jgi:hypothetical protein